LPSIPALLGYAAELETERDHVLAPPGDDAEEREIAEARREQATPSTDEATFTMLGASAQFDRVLYDGGEFGTSAEEEDFLGLPGLLEPDQVATLLRKRQADQARGRGRQGGAGPAPGPVTGHRMTDGRPRAGQPATRETLAALRKELNVLVRAWHHRSGQPHAAIHAELRRTCGGPALPQATSTQIRARIETVRRWAARGR
jgi:hypothetical protein